MKNLKTDLLVVLRGTANSYSQVFFSDSLFFAVLLIVISFFDSFAGLCGLFSVVITNIAARLLGFHSEKIKKGLLGFNSLLVGLGLGIYFQPGWLFFLILFLAALFTLFISVSMEGVIGKYTLPYLSVPFILSLWLVFIAARDFSALGISTRGIYTLNDLYILGGHHLVNLYEWWNNLSIPESLRTYFISLGAIFFQYSVFTGIFIAIGLLYYSRIAFSLSLIGFYSAFLFYRMIGADLNSFNYSYIGFNYILTSIAIGGFFLIPSRLTYFWTILLIPLVAIVTISLSRMFAVFGLSIYALPFNLIVLLFLYVLKFRTKTHTGLREVYVQYNSPEKNLYAFKNETSRFRYLWYFPVKLPVWGEWTISQGHDGEHTHKEEWRHAWDFVVADEEGKTCKGKGNRLEDYYCYDKTVTSPGDGVIEEVVDDIPDNPVGEVNIKQNWGNTVVIKHLDGLYSKLSHLKNGSIGVAAGDKVKAGQVIARAGNSGRSPYPHLHFQMQATPYIGSPTLDYPIGYFIRKTEGGYSFFMHDKPALNDRVSNIRLNPLLQQMLHLVPGQKIQCEYTLGGKHRILDWEVGASVLNQPYIRSADTGAIAYFNNDGSLFYFTRYKGSRNDMLYYFYLSLYKVPLGFYPKLEITDQYPVNALFRKAGLFFQDFLAPFYMFLHAEYRLFYKAQDDEMSPDKIELEASVKSRVLNRTIKLANIGITLTSHREIWIKISEYNKTISAKCTVL